MSSTIDYATESSGSEIQAEPVRLRDKGHGVAGTIFAAASRQATDWQTSKPKTYDDGNPVIEFVFNIAATGGLADFAKRDDEGNTVKGADGRTVLDTRKIANQDVCVITNYSLLKESKRLKLNTGDQVRIKRLTPANATRVEWEVERTGHVDNPQRFEEPRQQIDHGDDDGGAVDPF